MRRWRALLLLQTLIASVVNNGGFANLSLATPGTIQFDAVNLSLGRSISLTGPVVSNGTSSTLIAPYIQLASGAANSVASLAGTLTLKSTQTDIHGLNSIRGYQQTILQSGHIRFTSPEIDRASGLAVDGDLVLKASVIYPGSQINATVTAGNSITIQQNGGASLPLSAAGSLTLRAPVITQNGTLAAPFGSIMLDASSSLNSRSWQHHVGIGRRAHRPLRHTAQWQILAGGSRPRRARGHRLPARKENHSERLECRR